MRNIILLSLLLSLSPVAAVAESELEAEHHYKDATKYFMSGEYVKSFPSMAIHAENNRLGAGYKAGLMYYFGKGTHRDKSKGLALIKVDADDWYPPAIEFLASRVPRSFPFDPIEYLDNVERTFEKNYIDAQRRREAGQVILFNAANDMVTGYYKAKAEQQKAAMKRIERSADIAASKRVTCDTSYSSILSSSTTRCY